MEWRNPLRTYPSASLSPAASFAKDAAGGWPYNKPRALNIARRVHYVRLCGEEIHSGAYNTNNNIIVHRYAIFVKPAAPVVYDKKHYPSSDPIAAASCRSQGSAFLYLT